MVSELTPDVLAALEARHLAFLKARLVSDEAARDWRANVAAVSRALLSERVGSVVDAAAFASLLDAVLTRDTVERLARPLATQLFPIVLAELRAERGKLGDHVPVPARERLDALIAGPSLVPERLLRELVEQDAIEQILRDVLYDGFKEFAERVNPFTAEWGIPSLLKRMSVFGGAMAKGIESVKADFDRRLEPEISRFLVGFSRRGLERMVDVTIARADQPASLALRRHLLAWALEQEVAALAREADDDTLAIAREVGLDIAAAELDRPEGRVRRRALIEAIVASAKDMTIADALAALGVTVQIDEDALATASWPLAKAILASAPVAAWLADITHAFYESERGGA